MRTVLPKCDVCREPIAGRYHLICTDAGEKKFCTRCFQLPHCFACGIPCRNARSYPDGRVACADCSRDAVFSRTEAESLMRTVRAQLDRMLRPVYSCPIRLKLVELPEFERIMGTKPQNGLQLGLFHSIRHYRSRDGGSPELVQTECSIYVLKGLSRYRFIEVIAHELAHHWQKHNFPDIRDVRIYEGFAEYMASRINTLQGRDAMNRRMFQNPDPVYGRGYRDIRKIATDQGWSGLLKYLSEENRRSRLRSGVKKE